VSHTARKRQRMSHLRLVSKTVDEVNKRSRCQKVRNYTPRQVHDGEMTWFFTKPSPSPHITAGFSPRLLAILLLRFISFVFLRICRAS